VKSSFHAPCWCISALTACLENTSNRLVVLIRGTHGHASYESDSSKRGVLESSFEARPLLVGAGVLYRQLASISTFAQLFPLLLLHQQSMYFTF
jgi:hypothetical protein